MKKTKMVLGGIFWPVAFLFFKEMPPLYRANFCVAGMVNVGVLVVSLWLALSLGLDHIEASIALSFFAAVSAFFYAVGYFSYLRKIREAAWKNKDKAGKDINQDVIVSEFKTREDFQDTFKRVEKHAEMARACNPFVFG